MADEKTPLLRDGSGSGLASDSRKSRVSWPKRASSAITGTLRVVISTIFAPGYYVVACFYDDKGHFSVTMPFVRIGRTFSKPKRKRKQAAPSENSFEKTAPALDASLQRERKPATEKHRAKTHHERSMSGSSVSSASSSSSLDSETSEDTKPGRSIRIKAINEDALRNRRQKKVDGGEAKKKSTISEAQQTTLDTMKSPTSSASHLTRYPRAPAPPRPLIPRRQPSYTSTNITASNNGKKTLIIDLDETLIHSMAKGGRMSTGHMVEVKLQNPVGAGGAVMGPQVPILYYVHKRPHCDEFLKKVSKWYNLIVFTASVQEYADPVIDWLEMERKYFSKRYYRQDCTFRNGAFIKDLSHVEADLSRVMILDNSPLSYIFHEDNAIPIEGWISDPTDNDLLHLIPLLEGLQYTTDVRALLSLRLGEANPAT